MTLRNGTIAGCLCLGACWLTADVARSQVPGQVAPATPRLKLVAEEPPLPPVPEMQGRPAPRSESFPPAAPRNDPTVPGPAMLPLLGAEENTSQAGAAMPAVLLRARIISRNRPPMAVIEIGSQAVTIHQNSEVQVSSPTGGAMQLKVTELNAAGVRIEVLNRNQIISLN